MTTYSHAKPAGAPTWSDLMTPDVDAALNFYHAVFGWEYDIGGPEFGGMGPIDDSPLGRIAALMDPSGATFKIVQPHRKETNG